MLLKALTPAGAAYHLEQLYEDIRVNRMADLPILNHKLKVQAVGFREWGQYVLGVLITPWFMNLVLLPTKEVDWSMYGVGSKHSHTFEAGSFEFIVGEEERLGKYMSCSMFSPVLEFSSHAAAVETAEAIMRGLFCEENKEVLKAEDFPEDTKPNTSMVDTITESAEVVGAVAKEHLQQPISRRDLLRGNLFRNTKNKQGEKNKNV